MLVRSGLFLKTIMFKESRDYMQAKEYEELIQSLEQMCYEGAYEQAKKQAFHYYQLAIEEKNDFIELHMLRYMMMASSNLGQYEILLHFFERYEYLCHELDDEQSKLFLNLYLTFIYNYQGYYEQSMYVLKRACRMALKKNDQLAIVEAFSNACHTATLLKDYSHAIQYALIGMAHLSEDIKHPIFAMRIEMNLSEALIYDGQLTLAQHYIQRNHAIIEEPCYTPFASDQAKYYRLKALLAQQEQHLLTAKVYLKQAFTILLRNSHMADLVDTVHANLLLAKTRLDEPYIHAVDHVLTTLTMNTSQQRIDDITMLNIQRHVQRDKIATQTFDDTIGSYRAKGAFQIVNDWLAQQDHVNCAVMTIESLDEKDERFQQLLQQIHQIMASEHSIVGFNYQQILLFWRNQPRTLITTQLIQIEQLIQSNGLVATIGQSASNAETIYAKELHNFAYAQLYYMRELNTQMNMEKS